MELSQEHDKVTAKLLELYKDLFRHNGFGEMRMEIKFLKKGQKEVIIKCGKDYRYVVTYDAESFSGKIK